MWKTHIMGIINDCAFDFSHVCIYECYISKIKVSGGRNPYCFKALAQWLIWKITEIYVVDFFKWNCLIFLSLEYLSSWIYDLQSQIFMLNSLLQLINLSMGPVCVVCKAVKTFSRHQFLHWSKKQSLPSPWDPYRLMRPLMQLLPSTFSFRLWMQPRPHYYFI